MRLFALLPSYAPGAEVTFILAETLPEACEEAERALRGDRERGYQSPYCEVYEVALAVHLASVNTECLKTEH